MGEKVDPAQVQEWIAASHDELQAAGVVMVALFGSQLRDEVNKGDIDIYAVVEADAVAFGDPVLAEHTFEKAIETFRAIFNPYNRMVHLNAEYSQAKSGEIDLVLEFLIKGQKFLGPSSFIGYYQTLWQRNEEI